MRLRSTRSALLCLLVLGCAGDGDGPVDPGPTPVATSLEVVSGNDQTARVTEQLPEAIVVRVLDQNGEPLAGRSVELAVEAGNGHFVDAVVESDANGLARFEWVLGTIADATHRAVASLVAGSRTVDQVTLRAVARPGPVQSIAIIGDTLRDLERADTLFVHARGHDEFGNAIPGDSLDVVWVSSNSGVAALEGHHVVGVSEGDVVVTGTVGDLTARVHVFVEGTIATRFRLPTGRLIAENGRLLLATGDVLYEWNGSTWTGAPISVSGAGPTDRLYLSPDNELWLEAYVDTCTSDCPQSAFFRSTSGGSWSQSIFVGPNFNRTPRLAFASDGQPVLLDHDYDTTAIWAVPIPKVLRLTDGAWTSLDLPREVGSGMVFGEGRGIAIAANGDVYVVGSSRSADDVPWAPGRPVVARWNGSSWSFPTVPFEDGSFVHIEAANGTVYLVRESGNRWDVARVNGDAVQRIATPLDGQDIQHLSLAVAPTGQLAIAYSGYGSAGVLFQTAGRWEQWENPMAYVPFIAPVWHDGKVWFANSHPMTDTDFVVRLDPEE